MSFSLRVSQTCMYVCVCACMCVCLCLNVCYVQYIQHMCIYSSVCVCVCDDMNVYASEMSMKDREKRVEGRRQPGVCVCVCVSV